MIIPIITPIEKITHPSKIINKLSKPKVNVKSRSNSSFEANPWIIPIKVIALPSLCNLYLLGLLVFAVFSAKFVSTEVGFKVLSWLRVSRLGMITWGTLLKIPQKRHKQVLKTLNIIIASLAIIYGIYILSGGERINFLELISILR